MSKTQAVAVIGAGPAGLAISALLNEAGIEHIVYEKENRAGGLFVRLHPTLTLLSPSFFNHLPLMKQRHVDKTNSMGSYAQYLQHYIEKNQPPLQLNTTVTAVTPTADGYRISTADGETAEYKLVIVGTGMASYPRELAYTVPEQIEYQVGTEWRGADYYRGKNVLVIGSGTSALELSALLAGQSNVWLAVKRLNAIPLHFAGINFHWLIHVLELLPKVLYPSLCKGSTREPPINKYIKGHIKQGLIKLVGADIGFDNGQAVFADGSKVKIDVVLNCTGYRYDTGFLPKNIKRYTNGSVICKRNQSISHPGLFMIGHPCAGAIDSKYLRGIRRDAARIMKSDVVRHLVNTDKCL